MPIPSNSSAGQNSAPSWEETKPVAADAPSWDQTQPVGQSAPPAPAAPPVERKIYPSLSPAEMARTGTLTEEPGAVTGGTVPDPEAARGLIPPDVFQGVLRAQTDVLTGGLAEGVRRIPAVAPLYKGVETSAASTLSGFTSPQNMALLAVFPEGKLPATIVGAYFEAQALRDAPAKWRAYQAETDPAKKVELLADLGTSIGIPLGTLAHTAGPQTAADVVKAKAGPPLEQVLEKNEPTVAQPQGVVAGGEPSGAQTTPDNLAATDRQPPVTPRPPSEPIESAASSQGETPAPIRQSQASTQPEPIPPTEPQQAEPAQVPQIPTFKPEETVKFAYVDAAGRDSSLEAAPEDAQSALAHIEKSGGEVHAVNGQLVGKRSASDLVDAASSTSKSSATAEPSTPNVLSPSEQSLSQPSSQPKPSGSFHLRQRAGESGAADLSALEGVAKPIREGLDSPTAQDVKAAGQSYLQPSKFTPFKEVLNRKVAADQMADLQARDIHQGVLRSVSSPAADKGISIYREAGGNLGLIQEQLARAKTPEFREAAKAALNLNPREIETAKMLDAWYQRKGERGIQEGLINGLLPNYVNHVWKRANKAVQFDAEGGGKLNPSFQAGKQRVLPTLFDGDQLGMKAKSMRASDLAAVYAHSMERASGARTMVKELLNTADPSIGGPIAITQAERDNPTRRETGQDLSNYQHIRHWAFKGPEGDFRGDVMVHPTYAGHLENAIRPATIGNPKAAATAAGKVAAHAFSGFLKATSFVKQNMLSIPGFHYAQEGYEAVGHHVNPFSVAEKPDPNNPVHVDAMKHGLMVASTHGGEQQWMEGLAGNKSILNKLSPQLRAATDYLFQEYIPAQKLQTYKAALGRNMDRFAKELKSGELTVDDVKYHTAKQVNDAFGHLNYQDMGRSENAQKIMRAFLLAPDFLEARARQAGQGVAGLVPGKLWRTHGEQRMAFWTLAAGSYIVGRALNTLLDGDPHFDKPFSVFYKNREYTMRSVPEDVYRAVTDFRRFALARLEPLGMRSGMEWATGMNYKGQKVNGMEQLRDAAANVIPLGLRNTVAKIPGLEGVGNEDISLVENFMSNLGLSSKRHSPVIDAHAVAHDWMKSKGIPTDQGVYPTSPYARLRNALEDQDQGKALDAYKDLLKTKSAPMAVTGFAESMKKSLTNSTANDKLMLRQLNENDKKTVLASQSRRQEILRAFQQMRQSPAVRMLEQESRGTAATRKAELITNP